MGQESATHTTGRAAGTEGRPPVAAGAGPGPGKECHQCRQGQRRSGPRRHHGVGPAGRLQRSDGRHPALILAVVGPGGRADLRTRVGLAGAGPSATSTTYAAPRHRPPPRRGRSTTSSAQSQIDAAEAQVTALEAQIAQQQAVLDQAAEEYDQVQVSLDATTPDLTALDHQRRSTRPRPTWPPSGPTCATTPSRPT